MEERIAQIGPEEHHVDQVDAPHAPAKPDAASTVRATTPTEHDVEVAPPVEREQLEHPVRAPGAVATAAAVHDAAEHGSPIAAAIERAHASGPGDRAQHLGGAAASAASGQATPRPSATPVGEDDEPLEVDPLAPVEPAGDHGPRRQRDELPMLPKSETVSDLDQ